MNYDNEEWLAAIETICRKCQKAFVYFRYVEDSEGHEDINYSCPKCGYQWWVDGCDS